MPMTYGVSAFRRTVVVMSGFSRTAVVVSGFSRTLVIGAAFVLAALPLGAQTTAPDGNAANGKRLFSDYYCYACHGTMGQGGSAGARIAPRPIAFAAFQKYLRQPAGQMPPFRATVVTDQELADIYAFLRSVPPSQPAKAIPLLNQ